MSRVEDVDQLLTAMGAETANIHLGTAGSGSAILKHLGKRKDGWLAEAAKAMAAVTTTDWTEWKANRPVR